MKKNNQKKIKIITITLLAAFIITQILVGITAVKAKAEENPIQVLVESYDKVLTLDTSDKTNAYEALKQVVEKNDIKMEAQDGEYGKYIASINDVKSGKFGGYDGWLYAVYRNGNYENITASIDKFVLKSGDKLIVYYGDMGTLTPNKIEYSTQEPNKELTISLNNSYEDFKTKKQVLQPIKGIKAKIDGKEVTVSENKIYLKEGLGKGSHTLQLIDFKGDKSPVVVNDIFQITFNEGNPPKVVSGVLPIDKQVVNVDVDKEIEVLSNYISKTEKYDLWLEISMNKLGITPNDKFTLSKDEYIKENENQISKEGTDKFSNIELEKLIMTLVNNGKDPYKFGKHDLIKELFSRDLKKYLLNDMIFGLITYDYCDIKEKYPITKDNLIQGLLSKKISYEVDGKEFVGWTLYGDKVEPDITAMVVNALSIYCDANDNVKDSVNKSVKTLSYMQNEDGYIETENGISSETLSTAIVGIRAMGLDPKKGDFSKPNGNLVTALSTFKNEKGLYKHTIKDADSNYISSEQALRAFITIKQSKNGRYNYYSREDFKNDKPTNTESSMNTNVLVGVGIIIILGGVILVLKNKKREQ